MDDVHRSSSDDATILWGGQGICIPENEGTEKGFPFIYFTNSIDYNLFGGGRDTVM